MEEEKVLMEIDLPFPRIGKGKNKVREMFDTSEIAKDTLLMVATDRVSVYDVILLSGIPGKGKVLTSISAYWFWTTEYICPNHLITDSFDVLLKTGFEEKLGPYEEKLKGRVMLVTKAEPIPAECIVRDRPLGSGWKSYQKTGKICGIKLPQGLNKGDKLPAPIFTPSTKAEYGEHDENITFEQMCEIVGARTAQTLRAYSLSIYSYIAIEAFIKGIEVPDTKFEFGRRLSDGQIIQIDESGTPDSSRFDPDYSKQPLRDYLDSIGWDKEIPIELPIEVIEKTSRDYIEGCRIITGYTVKP